MVAAQDTHFGGSIPQFYERHLVPLIFEPYAVDLARRVAQSRPSRVLEVAAGTGVVTRQLAVALPREAEVVASDLNQPMLDHAASLGTARPVRWEQADVMRLPFADHSFDAIVCQFAAMFFPDKPKAFSEVRRVLRPGGRFFFSVWDRIEENEFADVVTSELARMFPDDPPRFLARTPHGYHDPVAIIRHIEQGGFGKAPRLDVVAERSRAASPDAPAVAYCHGTPLRNEIEARAADGLGRATEAAAAAIAERFGTGAVDGKVQAIVAEVEA